MDVGLEDGLTVELERTVNTAVEPSPRVLRVASMFGLGIGENRSSRIVEPCRVRLVPGQVVFVTGPSGSGKSTILSLIDRAVGRSAWVRTVRLDDLTGLSERPVVDGLAERVGGGEEDGGLRTAMSLLSAVGLGDAFVMLRRPSELSEGQRYRLKLAVALTVVRSAGPGVFPIILADEFGSTLAGFVYIPAKARFRVILHIITNTVVSKIVTWVVRCGATVCRWLLHRILHRLGKVLIGHLEVMLGRYGL